MTLPYNIALNMAFDGKLEPYDCYAEVYDHDTFEPRQCKNHGIVTVEEMEWCSVHATKLHFRIHRYGTKENA